MGLEDNEDDGKSKDPCNRRGLKGDGTNAQVVGIVLVANVARKAVVVTATRR